MSLIRIPQYYISERPTFNRYADEPNLTGGSRAVDDSFKAPLPPAIRIADATSDTERQLQPFDSSFKSPYQSLTADARPKVVNFEDSIDCSDAFGTRISTEHLPGTPMEPADLVSGPDQSLVDASTTSTHSTVSSTVAAAERRRSLSTIISHHSEMPATAAALGRSRSLANATEDGSTPVKLVNAANGSVTFTDNSTLQTKRSSLAMVAPTADFISDKNRKNSKQDKEGLDPESLMFRDGRRKIDMVLCYEEEDEGVMTEQEARRREMRRVFLENLVREGLELELEDKSQSFDEKTFFVKIHMPWKAETRYAEVMNLKLPIKRFITISVKAWVSRENIP